LKVSQALRESEDGVDHAMMKTFTIKPFTIIQMFYHWKVNSHPHFDTKAWLPLKMAQGTVKWSI
jgi:hypothetical protein